MENNKDINQTEFLQEERILSYLRGEMSTEQEAIFMDDLQKDPDFKDKAISIARLAKGLKQVGDENDKILREALLSADEATVRKIVQQATETGGEKAKTIPFKKRLATILSLAASILFVVFLGFQYYDYNRTTSLGEQYATQFDTSVIRGDEQSETTKELGTLINNVYVNKDLSSTLKRLAVLWEVATLDTFNDYTNFAPEIGWALATGYLKDNNKEEALAVLEKMAKLYDADTAMGKKVRELQEKIK